MAYIDCSFYSYNTATFFLGGLDTGYVGNDRSAHWALYSDSAYQNFVAESSWPDPIIYDGSSSGGDYTFENLSPSTTYYVRCFVFTRDGMVTISSNIWGQQYSITTQNDPTPQPVYNTRVVCQSYSYDYFDVYVEDLDIDYSLDGRTVYYVLYDANHNYITEAYGETLPRNVSSGGYYRFSMWTDQFGNVGSIKAGNTYYILCTITAPDWSWQRTLDEAGPWSIPYPSLGNPFVDCSALDYDYISVYVDGLSQTYDKDDRTVTWKISTTQYGDPFDTSWPYNIAPYVSSGANHTFENLIYPDSDYYVSCVIQPSRSLINTNSWVLNCWPVLLHTPAIPLGNPSVDCTNISYNSISVMLSGLDSSYIRNDRKVKWSLYTYNTNDELVLIDTTVLLDLSGGVISGAEYTFNSNISENKDYWVECTISQAESKWQSVTVWSNKLTTPSRLQIDCSSISYDYINVHLINLDTSHRFSGRRVYWKLYSPIHSVQSSEEYIIIDGNTYWLVDAAWGEDLAAYASSGGDCKFDKYIYGNTNYYVSCTVYSSPEDVEWSVNAGPVIMPTPACSAYIDCSSVSFYYLEVFLNGLNNNYTKNDRIVYWEIRDGPNNAYFDSGSESLPGGVTSGGTHLFSNLSSDTTYYISCIAASFDGTWRVEIENVQMTTMATPVSNAYISRIGDLSYDSFAVRLDGLDEGYVGNDRKVTWRIYKILDGEEIHLPDKDVEVNLDGGVSYGAPWRFYGLTGSTEYHVTCSVETRTGTFDIDKDVNGNPLHIITPKGPPPYFYWDPQYPKESGGRFNLMAYEWNGLEENINLVRVYLDLQKSWFTTVESGQIFTASHYNEIVYSLRDLPIDRALNLQESGQSIYANYINDLRDAINSVPR